MFFSSCYREREGEGEGGRGREGGEGREGKGGRGREGGEGREGKGGRGREGGGGRMSTQNYTIKWIMSLNRHGEIKQVAKQTATNNPQDHVHWT